MISLGSGTTGSNRIIIVMLDSQFTEEGFIIFWYIFLLQLTWMKPQGTANRICTLSRICTSVSTIFELFQCKF